MRFVSPDRQLQLFQIKEINQKLEDFVNGKVSRDDIIQFLSETASQLQDAKKNYDDVAQKSSP